MNLKINMNMNMNMNMNRNMNMNNENEHDHEHEHINLLKHGYKFELVFEPFCQCPNGGMGPWVGLGWRLVAWISNLWNILNHPCLLNLHASLLPTRGSGPTWRPGYSSSIFSMGFYIELLTNNKTSVTIIFSRSFTLYSRQPTIFSLNGSRLYSVISAADYI